MIVLLGDPMRSTLTSDVKGAGTYPEQQQSTHSPRYLVIKDLWAKWVHSGCRKMITEPLQEPWTNTGRDSREQLRGIETIRADPGKHHLYYLSENKYFSTNLFTKKSLSFVLIYRVPCRDHREVHLPTRG